MDIKDVLKDRRTFASSFQKYIKMVLNEDHPLFNIELKNLHLEVIKHFDEFNNQIISLKDQFISIEAQLQDVNNTIKQFSQSSMDTNEFENIKKNLLKKKNFLKERIQKQTLKNYHYSLSLFDKYEEKIINATKNEKLYPQELINNQEQLTKGFPILLDFCYQWEADNLFTSSKINSDCRILLNQIQKLIKHINRLKETPQPFFDTKEYKNMSECLPIITKQIDNFVNDEQIWAFLKEQSLEHPRIIGFISIFEKKDFKSIRSKIRMFSHLEKTEELVKIIKGEFRHLEQLFSVYFYQLDAQKKEILNICLPITEYKEYILKQWIKKEFISQFTFLKSIEEEYQRQLLKF